MRTPVLSRASTVAVLAASLGGIAPSIADAAYTPPLTRVRIDADRLTHYPSLFFASDVGDDGVLRTELSSIGAQYILQKEWRSGWGAQVGLGLGRTEASAFVASGLATRVELPSSAGTVVGAQARAYRMLWKSEAGEDERASALTAFVNLRGLRHSTGDDGGLVPVSTAILTASMGVGAMAELALGEYVSLCPYAWFSPSLYVRRSYSWGQLTGTRERSLSVSQPLRVGLDVWIYPLGARSELHVSLSFIASLIDTEGQGSQELSGVAGVAF